MGKHKHKSAHTLVRFPNCHEWKWVGEPDYPHTCPDIFHRHHRQCLRRKNSATWRNFRLNAKNWEIFSLLHSALWHDAHWIFLNLLSKLQTKGTLTRGKFWAFIDPSGQNELYHTPLLSKIWDLDNWKKMVNNPLKVIKGNLRDLSDLERSLCQWRLYILQHQGKEEKATLRKAKQLWTKLDGSSNLVEELHNKQLCT